MAFTVQLWMIPTALTALIWGVTLMLPTPARSGYYDFGTPLTFLFRGVAALFATLVVWLIYFIIV